MHLGVVHCAAYVFEASLHAQIKSISRHFAQLQPPMRSNHSELPLDTSHVDMLPSELLGIREIRSPTMRRICTGNLKNLVVKAGLFK